MDAETKRFTLRTLLTVTTGRLLTKGNGPKDNGIGDLYELLGWMTNDSPMTHQLPRFSDECKPWLLRWFPELAKADERLPQLDRMLSDPATKTDQAVEEIIGDWARTLGCKAEYDVPRIPADDHTQKNPLEELIEMRGGTDGIIPLVVS